jgi:hypothetical protein
MFHAPRQRLVHFSKRLKGHSYPKKERGNIMAKIEPIKYDPEMKIHTPFQPIELAATQGGNEITEGTEGKLFVPPRRNGVIIKRGNAYNTSSIAVPAGVLGPTTPFEKHLATISSGELEGYDHIWLEGFVRTTYDIARPNALPNESIFIQITLDSTGGSIYRSISLATTPIWSSTIYWKTVGGSYSIFAGGRVIDLPTIINPNESITVTMGIETQPEQTGANDALRIWHEYIVYGGRNKI